MKTAVGTVLFLSGLLISGLLLPPGRVAAQTGQAPAIIEEESNGIPYMSGGVGEGEREKLEQMAQKYNLKLVFALVEGNYLALIDVRIKDFSGNTLLRAAAKGPWFYTSLPPGRYLVEATTLQGHAKQRQVTVSGGGLQEEVFAWKRLVPLESAR